MSQPEAEGDLRRLERAADNRHWVNLLRDAGHILAWLGREPNPYGHDCAWCGDCTERALGDL